MNDILPVILSGGSGTRLWPLSREAYPKQFLPLAGELTMLQATWQRVAAIAATGPLVIANEAHRFVSAEQLQQVGAQPLGDGQGNDDVHQHRQQQGVPGHRDR